MDNILEVIGKDCPEALAYITARVKLNRVKNMPEDKCATDEFLKEDFAVYIRKSGRMDYSFYGYMKVMRMITERELLVRLLTIRVEWYTFFLNRLIKKIVKEIIRLKEAVGVGHSDS